MTLDEAKQKILDRVLATTEGWEIGFEECATTRLTNAALPELAVKYHVDCPYGSPTIYSVRLMLSGNTILLLSGGQTDLCRHVRSILEAVKVQKATDFDNSVIQFAEKLPPQGGAESFSPMSEASKLSRRAATNT